MAHLHLECFFFETLICSFFSLFIEKLTKCQHHLHQLTGYSSLASSGDFVPKCRSDNGHYNSLQCAVSSSVCFCVDTFGGYELSGSRTVGHPDCNKFGMFSFVFLHLVHVY